MLFLAEAFTRPKVMYRLAKGGFTQSYTYFTWRNTKYEIAQYFTELCKPPVSDFFRPNLWPNTPDILPEFLQFSGRPGFALRLVLAATLGASYGIYGPAYELAGAPAAEARRRGVSRQREVPAAQLESRPPRQPARLHRPRKSHPARERTACRATAA